MLVKDLHMFEVREVELHWIQVLQGHGYLKGVMLCFSGLGSEALFYVMPIMYLVVSRRAGMKLYVLLSLSNCVGDALKIAFHGPRPYWVDSQILALSVSSSYGMPSGHVLSACIVWPIVGRCFKQPWASLGAFGVILLVSISRVYLGVHFFSDVICAWIVALLIVIAARKVKQMCSQRFNDMSIFAITALAFLAGCTLFIGRLGMTWAHFRFNYASSWYSFALDSLRVDGIAYCIGEFVGAISGVTMAGRWAHFDTDVAIWRRLIAVVYALAGCWFQSEFLNASISARFEVFQVLEECFQGALSTSWVLFLAPWLLLKAGLLLSSEQVLRAQAVAQESCRRDATP